MINGGMKYDKGQLVYHEERRREGKLDCNGEIVYVDWKYNTIGVRYLYGEIEEYDMERVSDFNETRGGGYWIVDVYD